MNEWIIRLIEQGGYWGIFVLMVVENVFPPIPSEVIMGLGGVAVARGTMSFWPLLLVGTIDNLLNPYLVAHRSRVGALTVFVGVIGGLAAFGALGLVMGPLILVLAAELLRLLRGPAAPA